MKTMMDAATLIVASKVQMMTPAEVLKAYEGTPGCMCGCLGRYFVTAERREEAGRKRGYAYEDRDEDESAVLRILRMVQAGLAGASQTVTLDSAYAAVEINGTRYVVYFATALNLAPACGAVETDQCEGCEKACPMHLNH